MTRALFEIEDGSWMPSAPRKSKSGSTLIDYSFRVLAITSGPLFDEVVGLHGHRLPMKNTQNALRYWPVVG